MKVSNQWTKAMQPKTILSLAALIFAFTCAPELRAQASITTASLPAGTVNATYSVTLTAAGGALPYSWSLALGSLPPGLTLTSTGLINGTPAIIGTSNFTVRVRDLFSLTAMKAFSITILPPPPVITTASPLPTGTAGVPYSQTLVATGGAAPFAWSVILESLPPGLTLSAAGLISGTPTIPGTAIFNVQIIDSVSRTAGKQLSITINPPPLSVSTESPLPAGTAGIAYSQNVSAIGGTPPYLWSIVSGALPAGLTLSAAGVISGSPTTVGSSNFTIQVADSSSQTVSKSFSIAINPPPLSITTVPPLPAATVGTSYSQTLAATGGTPPYAWSVASGALPAGLTLSAAGVISGSPITVGSSNFTIQVADSGSQTVSKSFSITTNPPPLSITTVPPLPAATVGMSYSQTLSSTGGTPPYAWSIASGALPAGLILSVAGVISGSPTTVGFSNFTVQLADSGSQTASKSFSIAINPPPLSITTASSLPAATVGNAYLQALAATGGTPPYSWSVASGALPAGLTLSVAGVISGTPAAASASSFTVQVTDSGSQTGSKPLSITINPPAPNITTASPLPGASKGLAYSVTLTASGGTQPYSWSAAGGSIPPGLTFSSSGMLSGTPTSPGTFNFIFQLSDGDGRVTSKSFALTVQAGLTITTTSPLPSAVTDSFYSQQFQASLADPLAWSVVSGNVPAGITLYSNGVISGTPTSAGIFDFSVQVTGGTPPQVASQQFRLEVGTGLVIATPPSLPGGTASVSYNATLNAAGGTAPYNWVVINGSLPNGLDLASSGLISGTPTTAGVFTITVQASDNSHLTATKVFIITIAATPLGSFSLTGVPDIVNAAQQVVIGLSLSAPQPTAISGSLKMAFTSTTDIPGDDPAVLFSNGSRTVEFTIPANSTAAVFPTTVLLLTGTVSGRVVLTADIQSGSTGLPVGSVDIPATVPRLTNVAALRTADGVKVQITGYSPDRRVNNAEFAFDVKTPAGTQRVNLVRNVAPEFDGWYRSPGSVAFGSSFVFEQSFSVQGDVSMIDSVTISLTNGQGSASSIPVKVVALD
ncbi:MAG: hypothetical protein DMG13_06135 [Acidobacteria bacterium]|nr:MAG: hypothetical protein DMG13_06135 [Acidobacteriota bacterium]